MQANWTLASLPTELTTAIRTDAEAALAEFHTGGLRVAWIKHCGRWQ